MACALPESPATIGLRVELTCPVCLELYLDPQQLPCGHNFCLRCVQRLIRPQRPLFHCPECRVSCSSTQQLHRNFKLANIADHYRNRRQGGRSEPLPAGTPVTVLCDYCAPAAASWDRNVRPSGATAVTAKPAAKMCLKCEVMMCREHLRPHLELPAFRDHPLTDPTEFSDFRKRKCRDHDEIYSYYCMDDKSFVCNACIVEGGHKGHTVKTLRNATKDLKAALDHQLNTAEKKSAITELKLQVENEKDRRNKNFEQKTENRMRQLRADMHVTVDGFVDTLLSLTHDHCDLNDVEIHRNITEIKRDKVRLQSVRGDIQGFVSENPFRFIEAYKKKEEQLQEQLQQRLFKPECMEGMNTEGLGEQIEAEVKAFLDILRVDVLIVSNFPEEEEEHGNWMEIEPLEVIREEDEDTSSEEEEEVYEAYDGEEEGTSREVVVEDEGEEGTSLEEDEDVSEAYDGQEEDGEEDDEDEVSEVYDEEVGEEQVGEEEEEGSEAYDEEEEDEQVGEEEEEGSEVYDEEEEDEQVGEEEEEGYEAYDEEDEDEEPSSGEEVGAREDQDEEVLEVGEEEEGRSSEEEEEEGDDQSESVDHVDHPEEEEELTTNSE